MIEKENLVRTALSLNMKSTVVTCDEIDIETNGSSTSSAETLRLSPAKKIKTPSESSHKVIEKRRRDRINKCLAELGHIVPKAQGTGKLEKAEILELTVEYIKKLQNTSTATNGTAATMSKSSGDSQTSNADLDQPRSCTKRELQSYTKGYSDCTNEVLHFMITVEATDPQLPCFQRLMAHLRNNCRLLIDFENTKEEPHKPSSLTSGKLHGHNKRSHFNSDGQDSGPKNKRSRDKAPDMLPDSGNGTDGPKPPSSTSGMTLEDKMKAVFKNGNNDGTSSPYNGNVSRNGKNNENGNGAPILPHYPPNMFPFGNQGYPSPYGMPAYAFVPAGTQYVPVPLHPGVQFPGNSLGGSMFPAPFLAPGLGYPNVPNIPSVPNFPNFPSMPMGGLSNPLGGIVPPYVPMAAIGGITTLKGPEGLPAYLAQDTKSKERNRETAQDSSGSSENESSGDEYNFSTSSSINLSEVGIQTDHPVDHSDYFSAGSR